MVPGTGCSVVGNVLREHFSGVELGRKHSDVPELLQKKLFNKSQLSEYLIFANIRNPFDRWVTYYQRLVGDWIDYSEGVRRRKIYRDKDRLSLSDAEVKALIKNHELHFKRQNKKRKIIRSIGFNLWIKGTIIRKWLVNNSNGKSLNSFAFPMLDFVDWAIRQEYLEEGLNRVLKMSGTDYLTKLPRKNETKGKKHYTEYYSWLDKKIIEMAYGNKFKKYGYYFNNQNNSSDAIIRL